MKKQYERALSLEELENMPDEEIDCSDIPELGDDFFQNARIVMPAGKEKVSIRLDKDVLDWFRAQGDGYQTRMNAVLKAYMCSKHL